MKDENMNKEQLKEHLEELIEDRTKKLSKANQELQKEITKRQDVEEKLLEERQRLFSVLDGLPAQVYLIAPDYSFRFSNRFFQERFGNPDGKPCYMVFHNRVEPCEQCSTFGTGKIKTQQGEWAYPDGYTYQVYDYPFIDIDGTELLLSFGLDITEQKKAEMELSRSEEKFSKAFRSNPDWMTISDLREGRYIEVNDAFLATTGYQRDEVIGHTAQDLGIWAFPKERDLMIKQIQQDGYVLNLETKLQMKFKETRTFLVSAEIIDMGGEQYLLGVCKDITQQRIMEERLRESEAELRTISENANGIIYTLSTEGKFVFVSKGWTETLGHHINEVKGHLFEIFVHPDDIPKCRDFLNKVVESGEPQKGVEYRVKHLDGTWHWHTSSGAPAKDEAGKSLYYVGIAVDITERKKAEDEIKYLSFHDKLTGLYNRAYFEEALKRIDTARQLPISLIMGDVNGLKLINDVLGHQEGDAVLKTVAEILRKSCRQEDIVARWGGDEFILLLPGCDMDIVSKISERIKSNGKHINDLPIETSLSVGLAIKDNIDQDIRVIIKEAEDKMYRNKLLETRSTRSSFLTSLEKTLWTRSHETQAHCQRMQDMAQKIGQACNLPESELDNIKLLAVLHDIGKIAIPNAILDKQGILSTEEWDSIKKHPEIGYRIALSSPEMAPIAEAILHHHERWDGTGYPLGLKGEEMPLISRIIAIVDAYDVMLNGRPYQNAVSQAEAWMEIHRCAGSQFDPDLARKAIELFAGE